MTFFYFKWSSKTTLGHEFSRRNTDTKVRNDGELESNSDRCIGGSRSSNEKRSV